MLYDYDRTIPMPPPRQHWYDIDPRFEQLPAKDQQPIPAPEPHVELLPLGWRIAIYVSAMLVGVIVEALFFGLPEWMS